jgi:hypothetical protein
VIVGIRSGYLTKTKPLIQLISPVVLQRYRERHLFVLLVSPSNNISQNARANAEVLMSGLDLNLANFYRLRLIEQLNHSYRCTIDMNYPEATPFPALSDMSRMPSLVPTAPCRKK